MRGRNPRCDNSPVTASLLGGQQLECAWNTGEASGVARAASEPRDQTGDALRRAARQGRHDTIRRRRRRVGMWGGQCNKDDDRCQEGAGQH